MRLGGIWPCFSTSSALTRPATPAAVSRWPRLVFTEPIGSGASAGRSTQSASASACASIGSPTAVPVPWASTKPICVGCDARIHTRVPHQARLRLRARKRNAVGVPILIQRRAEITPWIGSPSAIALREPLQQHHARAFSAHEAIGRGIERLAPAIGRKHRRLRKADESARRDHDRHAARERRIAAARADVLTRRMHRGERGGAGRIHRHARAVQIQAVRDAIGGDAVRAAGRRMRADPRVIECVPWMI